MTGDFHNFSYDYNNTSWFIHECTLNLNYDGRMIALFLLYLVVFMVGLAENSLVLWVIWRRRHSANGVLFCILNMSLSDMMVVFTIPFFMMEETMDQVWLWGHFLCKVTNLIYIINFYSSSFFLAFMTLERYLSLTRPNGPACFPLNRKRRWLLCIGIWLLSLMLALLENVHVDLIDWDQPGCFLVPEDYYMEWYMSLTLLALIFQFLGPASVIITCNILIARAVRATPDVQNRRDIWLVHVYSLVFVACWLPYQLTWLLLMLDDLHPHLFSCNGVGVLFFSLSLVKCCSLFHCIANPILYNFLSKSFQNNLINAVLSRISPAPASTMADNTRAQERKLSNTSTSHSDIGS